ncbi:uncharacterized protein LOC133518208 [Cydia pomonella]|uniref:uncharacterized protein LOC133518208 n=1 Tax=Cydia pomonella TaxID=82600 RepID=UPI002ADDB4B7|nr:uncharacterized protein LOC133518208 [Cydia pomonella]
MLEVQTNNDQTILDYLNEDCWRAVLKYVPVQDIIRTESTSRQWQRVVLQYLQGVHISILCDNDKSRKTNPNACVLKLSQSMYFLNYKSFVMWISKLGTSVAAAYCDNLETLIRIRENCPNLESLTLHSLHNQCSCCGLLERFPYNLNMDFPCLQGLYFYSCNISDSCITNFIADKALEELEICNCQRVTGDFFNTINLSNVKSLALESFDDLDSEHLFSAVERLVELKKLVLNLMPEDTFKGIQVLLDMMPKLEYLEIYDEKLETMPCYDYKPLSRLSCLKHLDVQYQLSDEAAEAILRGCKDLRTLEFRNCEDMNGNFVAEALCRWGTRLRSLSLMALDLDDDDIRLLAAIFRRYEKEQRLQWTTRGSC